jgi:hypothetical protein
MSIHEIVTIEDQNTGEIHLHKEGIFWKAYQQSAYLFTREVKAFKVSKKLVKAVGREVVSLGFPQQTLATYLEETQWNEIDEKHRLITGYSLQAEDYRGWLESLPLTVKKPAGSVPVNEQAKHQQLTDSECTALSSLREFRVERSTPMDCMLFVVSLQKQLDGSL